MGNAMQETLESKCPEAKVSTTKGKNTLSVLETLWPYWHP